MGVIKVDLKLHVAYMYTLTKFRFDRKFKVTFGDTATSVNLCYWSLNKWRPMTIGLNMYVSQIKNILT